MKKSAKILSLLLCLCMVLALLAGCGKTGGSSSAAAPDASKSEPAASAPSEPAEPAEPEGGADQEPEKDDGRLFDPSVYPFAEEVIELSLFTRFEIKALSSLPSGDWDTNPAYIQASEKLGVELEFSTVQVQNYGEMFQISLSSGDYADMYGWFLDYYSAGPDHAIEEDILVDLAPYMEDYAPDYYNLVAADDGLRKATTTDGGHSAAFYQIKQEADSSTNRGIFIRQDWLDEQKLETPATYDALHDALSVFKTEYGCTNALNLTMYGVPCNSSYAIGYDVAAGLNGFDDYLFQVDGVVKCGWVEDDFRDYLTMMNQWYTEGIIGEDFVATEESFGWGDQLKEAVYTGASAVWVAEYRHAADEWVAGITDDDNAAVSALPDPVRQEGDMVHLSRNGGLIESTGISVTTACQERGLVEYACAWINYWFTEEGSLLANYGFEGETYEADESGKIYLTDMVIKDPEGRNPQDILYNYAFAASPTRLDNKRFLTRGLPDDRDVWGTNRDGAYDLPAQISRTAEEATIFSESIGDALTYAQENVPRFINGERSIEEFEDFRQELIKMGVQDIIDVTQAALDRFNKR